MTKIRPITSKIIKVLRTKFINPFFKLHRSLIYRYATTTVAAVSVTSLRAWRS